MERSSKVLLDLESKNPSSAIESCLLLCKNDPLHSQSTELKSSKGKPTTATVPKSQVLGKVKDFLGVFSEANKRLQLDAKGKSEDYDIEILIGNESEYIEMDLMLGVTDLHTPEAVTAAESAIAGYHQPAISLVGSSSGSESEESSSDDDDDDMHDDETIEDGDAKNPCCSPNPKRSRPATGGSSKERSRNGDSEKKTKIVELS